MKNFLFVFSLFAFISCTSNAQDGGAKKELKSTLEAYLKAGDNSDVT